MHPTKNLLSRIFIKFFTLCVPFFIFSGPTINTPSSGNNLALESEDHKVSFALTDTIPPTAICQDITINPDFNGNITISAADIDGGSSDECGMVTLSASQTSFDCSFYGPNNVTLTVTDCSENTSTCVAVVTVIDNIAPVAICLQNLNVYLDETGNASIIPSDINGGSYDNCGGVDLSLSKSNFSCSDLGPNEVTLTVADSIGNSAFCITNVNVIDTISPNVICNDITVSLDFEGNFNLNQNFLDAGSSDNCDSILFSASQTLFTCEDIGINNIVITAMDDSGNTSTCMTTVTVTDNIPPVPICLQNLNVYLDETGNASIIPSDIDGGSNDNCGGVDLSLSVSNFSCSDLGSNVVTLTAADSIGNEDFCMTIVNVIDTISPVVTCVGPFSVYLDEFGNASIDPSDLIEVVTDNCNTINLIASQTSFTCADLGVKIVQMTAMDISGNMATCQTMVTVVDTISPNVICNDITVSLDFEGNFNLNQNFLDAGSSDNCDSILFSASQTLFTCEDIGINNIVITAMDDSGNTSTCMTTVTVIDNIPPVPICLQNLNVYLDETGNASIIPSDIDGGSNDNCGGVDLSLSVSNFSCSDLGSNVVTLTAADSIGNEDFCMTIVNVIDTISPVVTCVGPFSVYLDEFGNASINPSDLIEVVTDNCNTINLIASQTSFTCADLGVKIVQMTAMDISGNMATCQTMVTVVDTISPNVVCFQGLSASLDFMGNLNLTADDFDAGSFDNCGDLILSASQTLFTCEDIGINNIVITAIDESGNMENCMTTLDVQDNTVPVPICQQNVDVYLDEFGNAFISPIDIDGGSYDNCGGVDLSLSKSNFSCSDLGPNVVTLTAADSIGNSDFCITLVDVLDTIPPVAVCVDQLSVYLDGSGNASIDPIDLNGGSTDNCGTIIFTASQTQFTCADTSLSNVFMTVTDGSGNITTCQTNLVVFDTNSVSLTCQELTVFLDVNGSITIDPEDLIVDASDGCGSLILSASQTQFTCDDIGGNNVVVTAIDESGNIDSCLTVVIVVDAISPTIICQDITVDVGATGMATIDPSDVDDGSIDNCGTVYLGISNTTFTCADLGPNMVTLAASDDAGNANYCIATVMVQDTNFLCPWPSIYVYVDATKTEGANIGVDWNNALLTIGDAIYIASQYSNIEEIWVAGSTYYPTSGTNRNISYYMIDDIKIYGGFAGNESLLSERDIVANSTILSGDIGVPNDISDNSYQLITVSSSTTNVILDGFIIQNGNANDTIGSKDKGAGIYCEGKIKVENCTITSCNSSAGGAAIQSNGMSGDITLKNCTIENNNSAVGDDLENTNGATMTFQGNNIIED